MARKTHVESSGFNVTPLIPKSKQQPATTPNDVVGTTIATPPSIVKKDKVSNGKRKRKPDVNHGTDSAGNGDHVTAEKSIGDGAAKTDMQIMNKPQEVGAGESEGLETGGDQDSQPKKKKMRHRSKLDPSERKGADEPAPTNDHLSKRGNLYVV